MWNQSLSCSDNLRNLNNNEDTKENVLKLNWIFINPLPQNIYAQRFVDTLYVQFSGELNK
ncbi:hypothetical protein DA097_01390 [Vibrio rotiferianus]|nr:hypothetical protein DA097_01390 [Vibrio rotiferianus]